MEKETCENCGGVVSSYPNGCPTCGAPQCCQVCCKVFTKEEIDRAKAEGAQLAKLFMQDDLRCQEEFERGKAEGKRAAVDAWFNRPGGIDGAFPVGRKLAD